MLRILQFSWQCLYNKCKEVGPPRQENNRIDMKRNLGTIFMLLNEYEIEEYSATLAPLTKSIFISLCDA